MQEELRNISHHMRDLGLAALAHANTHANFSSYENDMWSELSVLQVAHAGEILIKARIAEEHPLLIFEQLPRSNNAISFLDLKLLSEQARTYQYFDLPERLWATTGIRLINLEVYQAFGKLRNSIQHFAPPPNVDFSEKADEFIYKVIDPFINNCWGLFAIDYCEDEEPYIYLVETLIRNKIEFLVSPGLIEAVEDINEYPWPKAKKYQSTMKKRFISAGYTG